MTNQHIIFRERDTANNVYSIEFTLQSVVFVDDNHAQFAGIITMGGNKKRVNGIIEYWFNVGKFYRILNKRKKNELVINPLWNSMSFIKVLM